MRKTKWLAALAACALALLAAGCNNGFTDAALNAMKNNAEQTVPVEGITLNRGTLTLNTGRTATLKATVLPENATDKKVKWSSSDEKIATVSENGTVTAVAEGTAVITAKAGSLTATCTVNVTACSHYYSNGKCIYCGLELPTVGGFQIDEWGTLTEYAGNDTNVVIPEGVTRIGYGAFKDNTGITSVEIPDGVTSIRWSAFSGCTSLTDVKIPDGVTEIESGAFEGCENIAEVQYTGSLADWCAMDNDWNLMYYAQHVYLKDGTDLKTMPTLEIPQGIVRIGGWAFYGCTGLGSVEIPASVTSIGDRAFYGCTSLGSVTIGDGVMIIGNYAFYGCTSLAGVTIPGGVTYIWDGVFEGCTGLTDVTIGDGVTSIGSSVFSGCSGLTSVDIPDSVTEIGNSAFRECTSLASVTIPEGVTSIGYYAFRECYKLTNVRYNGTKEEWNSIEGLLDSGLLGKDITFAK